MTLSPPPALEARALTTAHERSVVSRDLNLTIPLNSFTVIVGPNACGKSTLLRTLARVLPAPSGGIFVHGEDARRTKPRVLARTVGLLPQTAIAPEGIRVADLIGRGRHPHQSALAQWSAEDESAVEEAMAATGVSDLADRLVDRLSGGQRQRVWVAMLLAQKTPILLLDEPTTFLDIAHQYELLELLETLRSAGKTVVAVLHDLNQAARYASQLVVMKDGEIVADGDPHSVLTAALVREVFGVEALIAPDPVTGTPSVFPYPSGAQTPAPSGGAA